MTTIEFSAPESLPQEYREMYEMLVNEAAQEVRAVPGQTLLAQLMAERVVYSYVRAKQIEEQGTEAGEDAVLYRVLMEQFRGMQKELSTLNRAVLKEETWKRLFLREVAYVLEETLPQDSVDEVRKQLQLLT